MIRTADPIVERMRGYNSAIDEDRLRKAFAFGRDAHDGQIRASGEPYFTHPVAVANILIDMRLDEDTIITALLHDTVEDCDVTLSALDQQFGGDVPTLVDGVTKLSRIAIQSSPSSAQAENFRKLLMAMSEDVRVLLVKLADRTHNMRTLSFIKKPDKQQRIARETMDIFAPLAEHHGALIILALAAGATLAALVERLLFASTRRRNCLNSSASVSLLTSFECPALRDDE